MGDIYDAVADIHKRIDRIEAIQREILEHLGLEINLFRNPLNKKDSYIKEKGC